jgi:hypothetical protein
VLLLELEAILAVHQIGQVMGQMAKLAILVMEVLLLALLALKVEVEVPEVLSMQAVAEQAALDQEQI